MTSLLRAVRKVHDNPAGVGEVLRSRAGGLCTRLFTTVDGGLAGVSAVSRCAPRLRAFSNGAAGASAEIRRTLRMSSIARFELFCLINASAFSSATRRMSSRFRKIGQFAGLWNRAALYNDRCGRERYLRTECQARKHSDPQEEGHFRGRAPLHSRVSISTRRRQSRRPAEGPLRWTAAARDKYG
jgi:hypothetical protein